MKKVLCVLGSVAGLAVAGLAFATTSPAPSPILTVPTDFVSAALTYTSQMFTDLTPLILIVVAVPLAFWILRKIVSMVRAR